MRPEVAPSQACSQGLCVTGGPFILVPSLGSGRRLPDVHGLTCVDRHAHPPPPGRCPLRGQVQRRHTALPLLGRASPGHRAEGP